MRLPRFTIRDLLLLTTLIAVLLAWRYDHLRLYARTEVGIELLLCDSLIGLSRSDVVAFLGSPEMRVVGDRWFYWAGTGKERDPVWLELEFNNDLVVNARHRTFRKQQPSRAVPGRSGF